MILLVFVKLVFNREHFVTQPDPCLNSHREYGEGHNTAAKNIRNAILAQVGANAEVMVVDPYTRTNPMVNSLMQQGYSSQSIITPAFGKSFLRCLASLG